MKKLKYYFLTLVLFFFAVEGLLQAFSIYAHYSKKWEKDSFRKSESNHKEIILCFGESTTFMGGKNSYPAYLQRLLDEKSPNRYQVINLGIPSITTTQILSDLEENIDFYEPSLSIFMIGINDLSHEKELMEKVGIINTEKMKLELKIPRFILNFKRLNFIKPQKIARTYNDYEMNTFKIPEILKEMKKLNPRLSGKLLLEFKRYLYSYDVKKLKTLLLDHRNKISDYGQEFLEFIIKLYLVNTGITDLMEILKDAKKLRLMHSTLKHFVLYNEGTNYENLYEIVEILYLDNLSGDLSSEEISMFYQQLLENYLFWEKEHNVRSEAGLRLVNSVKKRIKNLKTLKNPISKQVILEIVNDIRGIEVDELRPELGWVNIPNERTILFENEKSKENVKKILNILKDREQNYLFVNYPFRRPNFIYETVGRDKVIDNYDNFITLTKKYSYEELFIDGFAGNFGHFSSISARSIAKKIVEKILR